MFITTIHVLMCKLATVAKTVWLGGKEKEVIVTVAIPDLTLQFPLLWLSKLVPIEKDIYHQSLAQIHCKQCESIMNIIIKITLHV